MIRILSQQYKACGLFYMCAFNTRKPKSFEPPVKFIISTIPGDNPSAEFLLSVTWSSNFDAPEEDSGDILIPLLTLDDKLVVVDIVDAAVRREESRSSYDGYKIEWELNSETDGDDNIIRGAYSMYVSNQSVCH